MNIEKDIEKFSNDSNINVNFNYSLKKHNWFNIGGNTKVFFKAETLNDLSKFMRRFGSKINFFSLGAGSNILVKDSGFDGVIIKLGKSFTNISLLNDETIIAGSAALDHKVSNFAKDNGIGGLEFLSCIPGSIGGGIRMNSGCYGTEFKDILLSVQAIDKNGSILTIPSSKINFEYRKNDLSKELIFLSASIKGKKKSQKDIEKKINFLKAKKLETQPSQIKTGGSTFKNPKNQTEKKVWELINEIIPRDKIFGDAAISGKHSNFFVNKKNASYDQMKQLIDFVTSEIENETGIKLELEIEIVG
tara:strand:- start:667 stop:1578 length:912 start_codon:yes stop_codon:yes gene_type:complete